MRTAYGATDWVPEADAVESITVNGATVEMVVLPNTLAYVQSYFGCSDGTTGALLEDSGGSGSLGSHWERSVYYDEALTASVWSSMMKISALTLNLFKDTNYFYDVDVSQAVPVYYGKGKGCDFAQNNLASASPEYCTGSGFTCGFYQEYGGPCSTSDSFANRAYTRTYSNVICNRA